MGLIDGLRFRLHLSICGNCRKVEQQIKRLQAMTADPFSTDSAL